LCILTNFTSLAFANELKYGKSRVSFVHPLVMNISARKFPLSDQKCRWRLVWSEST